MADLAELGIRISSEEAALADDRLDAFAASAMRAETAAEGLAGGARSASSAVATMNAAVRQQDAVLRAQQVVMRTSTLEGLNLTRQFSDIGVSLAGGINPLMVFIQQGPQIADIFQQAAAEGRSFNTVLSGLYARLSPILIPLAAVATAAGIATAGLALFNREIGKGIPDDLSKGLGLAEEQMKRLKESGVDTSVTLGDTFKATFQEIGANIVGFMKPATDWLAEQWTITLDGITEAAATGTQAVLGFFLGTYRAVMATWRNFPAAFGDMVIQGANAAITALNGLINRAVDGLNWLDAKFAGGQMQIQHFAATLLENPVAGAASQDATATAEAYTSAFADVGRMMDNFADGVRRRAQANRVEAIREAAGDPNKGRQPGKSDAEKLQEEIDRYIQSLKDQAATIGMSAIASKEYEIAQRAAKAAQIGMNDEVEEAGRLLIEKMKLEAANTRSTDDALEVIRLEARLIGAGNIERAVAIAQLQKMQELERAGVKAGDPGYDTAVQAAGQLARETGNLAVAQDRYNDSLQITLDLARQVDDHVREAAQGLGDAFGPAGEAIGGVASSLTALSAQLAEIAEVEDRMRRDGTLTTERQAMLERDRAQAQIANYGDMLGAAKGYFSESSDGYRILQTAEQAFRLFQFAMSVQSMAQGAAETAISIAQSGSKAAASTAAGAAKMFEFLGPFAFPAVAAMLGVLLGLGLKGSGGSGSYSATAANDNTSTDAASVTATVQAYGARDAQARDTAAASIAQAVKVEIGVNDDRFNAYVDGRAAPLAASAGVASFETSAKTLPTEGARRARQQFG